MVEMFLEKESYYKSRRSERRGWKLSEMLKCLQKFLLKWLLEISIDFVTIIYIIYYNNSKHHLIMKNLNKKLEDELKYSRGLAKDITIWASILMIFLFIVFFALGIFSSESVFSSGQKMGYALAVLVPTTIAMLIAWLKFFIIKGLLKD